MLPDQIGQRDETICRDSARFVDRLGNIIIAGRTGRGLVQVLDDRVGRVDYPVNEAISATLVGEIFVSCRHAVETGRKLRSYGGILKGEEVRKGCEVSGGVKRGGAAPPNRDQNCFFCYFPTSPIIWFLHISVRGSGAVVIAASKHVTWYCKQSPFYFRSTRRVSLGTPKRSAKGK